MLADELDGAFYFPGGAYVDFYFYFIDFDGRTVGVEGSSNEGNLVFFDIVAAGKGFEEFLDVDRQFADGEDGRLGHVTLSLESAIANQN